MWSGENVGHADGERRSPVETGRPRGDHDRSALGRPEGDDGARVLPTGSSVPSGRFVSRYPIYPVRSVPFERLPEGLEHVSRGRSSPPREHTPRRPFRRRDRRPIALRNSVRGESRRGRRTPRGYDRDVVRLPTASHRETRTSSVRPHSRPSSSRRRGYEPVLQTTDPSLFDRVRAVFRVRTTGSTPLSVVMGVSGSLPSGRAIHPSPAYIVFRYIEPLTRRPTDARCPRPP